MGMKFDRNIYEIEAERVIKNLKMRSEGMSLDEIKDKCYTIHFQGTTKTSLYTEWMRNLQGLAEDGLITIANDIVKLNQEKYNEIEFFE